MRVLPPDDVAFEHRAFRSSRKPATSTLSSVFTQGFEVPHDVRVVDCFWDSIGGVPLGLQAILGPRIFGALQPRDLELAICVHAFLDLPHQYVWRRTTFSLCQSDTKLPYDTTLLVLLERPDFFAFLCSFCNTLHDVLCSFFRCPVHLNRVVVHLRVVKDVFIWGSVWLCNTYSSLCI